MWLVKFFAAFCLAAVCAAEESVTELPAARSGIPVTVITTITVPAAPSLELKSSWLAVFPSENVILSCKFGHITGWTITWFRDGVEVPQSDPTMGVLLSEDRTTLTITAELNRNSGSYTCKGRHNTNALTTASNSKEVTIYNNNPKPTLSRGPDFSTMYSGESVTFSCKVDVGSEWEYLWYINGMAIPGQNSDTYRIGSITTSSNGQYRCNAKRGQVPFFTEKSDSVTLRVSGLPKTVLSLVTPWDHVFENEAVEFHCECDSDSDTFDWTINWYKNQKLLREDADEALVIEESMLNITSVTKAHEGSYTCRVSLESRGVRSQISNAVPVKVYDKIPKPTIRKVPALNPMYVGETVDFTCDVAVATGWAYLWKKDADYLAETNSNISIRLDSSRQGKYSCEATRGETTTTPASDELAQDVLEIPVPSLTRVTQWLEVFPDESVKLSCAMGNSDDWTYTWSKDGQTVQADNTVTFSPNGATLSIRSASAAHTGQYNCMGHLKDRSVRSTVSSGISLTVYGEKPRISLTQDPNYTPMFSGESVSFTCHLNSPGFEYLWFKNGQKLDAFGNKYTLSPVEIAHRGSYTCQAKRGLSPEFFTEFSSPVHFDVRGLPKTVLSLVTPWDHVFENEAVGFICDHGSDWTINWYRNQKLLQVDAENVLVVEESMLNITAVTKAHEGDYTCRVSLESRGVRSQISNAVPVKVYDKIPKPTIEKVPALNPMYVGETVDFTCDVATATGWAYLWKKDGDYLAETNRKISIRLESSRQGKYSCQATRGETTTTPASDELAQDVLEIPVPSLTRVTQWLDVFPDEKVILSCAMGNSDDWTYTWSKDGQTVQADNTVTFSPNGATLSIRSASAAHAGQYNCTGHLNHRSVRSNISSGISLTVYDAKPTVTLVQNPGHSLMHSGDSVSFSCHINVSNGWEYQWYKNDIQLVTAPGNSHNITSVLTKDSGSYRCQSKRGKHGVFKSDQSQTVELDVKERPQADIVLLTGWSQVFSTDSLVLKCDVKDSSDSWNYTWYKENQPIPSEASERYIVTPDNNPDQSEHSCQGVRIGNPSYSKISENFKTKNLLLKRRVLLSISGCIVFGIAAVMLGCIALRIFRKPVKEEYKPEEGDLFVSMARQKDGNDTSCPLVQFITDAALNSPPKEEEENGMICSEATPLPITTQEDQAVTTEEPGASETNGGLVSFKQ